MLAAEEHDVVVEDGAADLGHDVVGKVGREVDTADHRAAHARDRLDGDVPVGVPGGCRGHGDQRFDPFRANCHPPSLRTCGDAYTASLG